MIGKDSPDKTKLWIMGNAGEELSAAEGVVATVFWHEPKMVGRRCACPTLPRYRAQRRSTNSFTTTLPIRDHPSRA
jgi:hypothetical protein